MAFVWFQLRISLPKEISKFEINWKKKNDNSGFEIQAFICSYSKTFEHLVTAYRTVPNCFFLMVQNLVYKHSVYYQFIETECSKVSLYLEKENRKPKLFNRFQIKNCFSYPKLALNKKRPIERRLANYSIFFLQFEFLAS